ncbi:exostosin family protein [Cooperia oncophora]
MGSAQSQEEQPDVVRIDRSEIPEEYKTVGVSSDVVKRVNAQTGGGSSSEAERLREELARERAEKERLKQEMTYLSELQKRQQADVVSQSLADDYEERKRIFNETLDRVEERFFQYHRENVCEDHEKSGNVLTPIPSKEFYEVREMLLPYSVSDPQQACVFFPGVDFLNLHRFPSIDAAHAVANMVNERFHNVLILTIMGQWNHSHRHIMASPIIPIHLYRHRLDISLPPYFGNLTKSESLSPSARHNLLVMLFNSSSSLREEGVQVFGRTKGATILTECVNRPSVVCDAAGKVVDWEKALEESKFVLIHERMPHFKYALYRALQATVIPVIFTPNHVLPFADYIDWHLISLRPSSLARVNDVINSLDNSRVERIRDQIRKIRNEFSSLQGIVSMVIRVLESRMLPIKARSYEQWNMFPERPIALPHMEPAPQLLMVIWAGAANVVQAQQDLRQLVSSQLISSVIVIWRDNDNVPSYDGWETAIPVEIVTGIERVHDVRSIVKQKKTDVLLIVPPARCDLDKKVLRKAVNIWRTVPERRVVIHCTESPILTATIVHKLLLSTALNTPQLITSFEQVFDLLEVHPALHVITREQADDVVCCKLPRNLLA